MELIEIIKYFGDYGVLGIILAIVIYDNYKMKKKLFEVIESNTKAVTELTGAVTALKEQQAQRRKEFS